MFGYYWRDKKNFPERLYYELGFEFLGEHGLVNYSSTKLPKDLPLYICNKF